MSSPSVTKVMHGCLPTSRVNTAEEVDA
jgi:hypothetical protein